jgi:hypothetical protein
MECDADGVIAAGEQIEARTVIWGAGVIASPAAKWLGVEADRAGRAARDETGCELWRSPGSGTGGGSEPVWKVTRYR